MKIYDNIHFVARNCMCKFGHFRICNKTEWWRRYFLQVIVMIEEFYKLQKIEYLHWKDLYVPSYWGTIDRSLVNINCLYRMKSWIILASTFAGVQHTINHGLTLTASDVKSNVYWHWIQFRERTRSR